MNVMTALILQDIAGIVALTGTLVVAAVVIFLIFTSNKDESEGFLKNNFFKSKGGYFWGTGLLLICVLFLSLILLPYSRYKGEPDEVVTVAGIQWDWRMAIGMHEKKPGEFFGKNEISLPVKKKIKFILNSGDVTHNFGIFTSTGVLLSQVQVIPEYTNELQYVFKQKGKYKILCMEYCGLAHAFMTATIHVY